MRKEVCMITLFLLIILLPTLTSAEPINIILKTPSEGMTVTTYTTDFIYSFDQYAKINNCSLIVDDEIKAFRNTMIAQNNNKISTEISAGSHTWFIKCYDSGLDEIVSAERTLTVEVGGSVKSGYETIYNPNGLRSYAITPMPGQEAVTLPAIKGGEDIQIKISGKTYYLDILKMGASANTSFVEVRDRASGAIHKMLTPSALAFDFNDDKTNEIELLLKEVERNINAYFVVTPYPGTAPEEEAQPETPAEEPATPPEETPPVVEPEETPEENQAPVTPPAEEGKTKSKAWLIIIIIVVVVIILLITLLVGKGGKKPKKKMETKKKMPAKPAKQETAVKKEAKPEAALPKKEEAPAKPDEEWPVLDEKFEIIKSTGRRGKK